MNNAIKLKRIVKDYFFIAIGSLILAFAVSFFLVPSKISTGGVSGVATLLYYLLKIPLSMSTLVINAALFAIGFRMMPKDSLCKTLAGILLFSLSLELTEYLASMANGITETFMGDVWISTISGGVLVGVGVGFVVSRDASTGGSDFAALILNRAIPHVSIATFILIIDSLIIILSGIFLSDYSIIFYSVISLYISSKTTDFIVVSGNAAKTVCIISDSESEIARKIMERLERGVTKIYSRGCYAGNERGMLMCVVRPKEVPRILQIIRETDLSAFTVISDAKDVRGLGFKII